MALQVGNKLSEQMREIVKQSLTNKDFTRIAADNDFSHETVRALVYGKTAITDNTYELAKAILREAFSVNNLQITRRRTNNQIIESIMAEQAA